LENSFYSLGMVFKIQKKKKKLITTTKSRLNKFKKTKKNSKIFSAN